MRRIRLALLTLAAISALSVTAAADELGRPDFDPGSVLVITRPSYGLFKLQSIDNASDVLTSLELRM